MKQTESQIQSAYFQLVRQFETKHPALRWVHHIPNGGARHIRVATKLKAQGVRSGVWDVFIPVGKFFDTRGGRLPLREEFSGFYIEFKRDAKQKLTENQSQFQKFVEGQGYKTAVFWDAEEAFNATTDYLGLPRLIKGKVKR